MEFERTSSIHDRRKSFISECKIQILKKSLKRCFNTYSTDWENKIKSKLIEIILYTLENQQIIWENKFYFLNRGIPTGGKHSVPLANVFLEKIYR